MKIPILVCCLGAILAAVSEATEAAGDDILTAATEAAGAGDDTDTDDVYNVDGVRYRPQVLSNYKQLRWPFSLAVDYNNDNLYFVANYRVAVFNLSSKQFVYIKSIPFPLSFYVDQVTGGLYVATAVGIYKYKPSTGEAELIGAVDIDVSYVYFKRVLYYTNWPTWRVSTLNNGHSETLANMQYSVFKLVIDDDEVMFFYNGTGMYSKQLNRHQTTLYYNETYVNDLAMNRDGTVYFACKDGIYEVVKYNTTYRKVISINEPKSIIFDKNSKIIYCDGTKIYSLNSITEVNKTSNCSDRMKGI